MSIVQHWICLTSLIKRAIGHVFWISRTLSFASNQMNGTLPDGLGSLVALTTLSVGTNSISGTLPTSLQSLVKVTGLDISHNLLTGTIPAALQGMTALRSLSSCGNLFSGDLNSSSFYGSTAVRPHRCVTYVGAVRAVGCNL